MENTLRLGYDGSDDCVTIEVLDEHRVVVHGFGTFLDKVDPSEVLTSQEALDKILAQPERSGVQGMEFFPHGCVAWGSTAHRFKVPLNCINVPEESKVWIKKFTVEE